ncbi:MAG: DegV family protein [Anaerolineales bacterium]|nr:DegV family protein [Anaerolineales bacterium]
MNNIRIVTDSTCDLPEERTKQLEITVVPLHINQGENTYLDGINLSREEFYRQLPGYQPSPSTATPGPDAFTKVYNQLADEGAQAVLSIHISETLSATINAARVAAEQFTRIPVTVLDSSQLSLGTGFLVEKAALLAQTEKKVEEIVSSLQEVMKRTYVFASIKTLEYLRRSGRMNFAIAKFGELFQIKPLLHMNMGKATAHRTRTQKRATARLMEWLAEYAPYEKLALLHAGVHEEARALYEQARSFFPQGEEILIVQITPALGAHLGIGALGFACISKE